MRGRELRVGEASIFTERVKAAPARKPMRNAVTNSVIIVYSENDKSEGNQVGGRVCGIIVFNVAAAICSSKGGNLTLCCIYYIQ